MPESDLPWVISVDDHVVEPPHVWTTWLPAKLRARGPHVEQDSFGTVEVPGAKNVQYVRGGDGPVADWWVYEDLMRPIPQVMACVGFPRDELTAAPIPFAAMRPGCYDPVARLADMDLNCTERSMCFPSFPRFAGQVFLEARDKDLASACVRAFNDWMSEEWCGPSGGRLIPLGLVPLWDPALAAAEVRRNAGRGFHAIAFTELPSNLGLPSIHDRNRHWDPVYRACEETETVLCMHIGSSSRMPSTSPDAPFIVSSVLTFQNAMGSMVDYLFSGILTRFPNFGGQRMLKQGHIYRPGLPRALAPVLMVLFEKLKFIVRLRKQVLRNVRAWRAAVQDRWRKGATQ